IELTQEEPTTKAKTSPKVAKSEITAKQPKPERTKDIKPGKSDVWQSVLSELKKSHSTLYSILRMATFTSDGAQAILAFSFPFHKKRAETSKNRQVLSDTFATVAGDVPEIVFILGDKPQKNDDEPVKKRE